MKNNNMSEEELEFEKKWIVMLKGWKMNEKKNSKKKSSNLFMRLYYGLEELIWLMVSVGILVLFIKLFSFFSSNLMS